jgi:hypothetical protein
MKRHLESEIKTLQNTPRDADKLRRLLELKQKQKEEVCILKINKGSLQKLKY